MSKIFLFLVILSSSQVFALSTPRIEFDNNNVYVRSAMSKELVAGRMQELSQITVDLMQKKVIDMLATGEMPFELDLDTVNQIKDSAEDMTDFIDVANAYNETNDGAGRDQDLQDLIPTAFMATIGIKASFSLGASGAGSFTVGLVVMPIVEYVIPRRPDLTERDLTNLSDQDIKNLIKESTVERWTVSWAFIGWPNVDVGVGAGATVGAVRLGGGLIWGPLQSAKDFKGLVAGLSGNATLGVGLNVKVGVVHNSDMPGFAQMKYVLAGAEMGAAAEATARVNASVIFTDEQVLKLFFSGKTELSGEQIIEEYRREQIESGQEAEPFKFLHD